MMARRTRGWLALVLGSVLAAVGCAPGAPVVELVNVSYDPTRELYQDINRAFEASYLEQTGVRVEVVQSHGGSGAQARAVIDGLPADVVTLGLAGDTDALRQRGLIGEGWQKRLPNNSCPYTSTIVFLVRKGNPHHVKDWPDLVSGDVKVITPNPKTSGGARWNLLAAWGYVTVHEHRGEREATEFLRRLFANVPKLDTGARGSTDTFVTRKQGDVLIAWENEAILTRRELPAQEFEIVYPSVSILAEPPVAVVDRAVDERGTRKVAEAYLQFLYSDEAQDIIGRNGYRPMNATVLKTYADSFPAIKLFTIKDVAGDWQAAQQKFTADGGIFDQIYRPQADR
jgi:sulfate transport system substrate-binding protein